MLVCFLKLISNFQVPEKSKLFGMEYIILFLGICLSGQVHFSPFLWVHFTLWLN